MMSGSRFILGLAAVLLAAPAGAGQWPPPSPSFVDTLSNNAPLQFGLTPQETATALGAPLVYATGRPGNEVFTAQVVGGHFFSRTDTLFLQFRKGRLTGWKVDRHMASPFVW
jgi:hypothetical protein